MNSQTMSFDEVVDKMKDSTFAPPAYRHTWLRGQIALVFISVILTPFLIGLIGFIFLWYWRAMWPRLVITDMSNHQSIWITRSQWNQYLKLRSRGTTIQATVSSQEQATPSVSKSPDNHSVPDSETAPNDDHSLEPTSANTASDTQSKVSNVDIPATNVAERALAVVRVVGTNHHKADIRKAFQAARDASYYEPYEGETASEMKSDYRDYLLDDKIYEFPTDVFDDAVELNPEPTNKFDPKAIAVQINVDDARFAIGYVSAQQLDRIHKYVDDPGFSDKYVIKCEVSGGKSKHVEEDDEDFSDNPKLKIVTESSDIFFSVKIYKK